MHISEGILEAQWCIAGYAAAAPLAGYALKKLDRSEIPKVSVMGAAFFTASLLHFPVGFASSVHLTLIGLTGIILGAQAVLAILTGLFFQAVMFQHGGLTTLGLNTFTMGTAALLCRGLFLCLRRIANGNGKRRFLSAAGGFISGLGVLFAALLVSAVLWISTSEYAGIAAIFSAANGGIAIIEGLAALFVVDQILRIKPDLLNHGH